MRRKRAFLLLLVSLLLLGGCVVQQLWREYSRNHISMEFSSIEQGSMFLGITVVENRDFLEGKSKLDATENPGVYFEQTLLPYSTKENALYLSQKPEEENWIGRLSTDEDSFLCILSNDYLTNKEQAIRDGYPFTLLLVSGDSYYELSLVVSGMPVISVATKRLEVQEKVSYEEDPDKLFFDSEDLYYGDIRVFDPGVNSEQYEITECNVRYHHKGATSSNFEKKGYSISLQDASGENLDLSLLGMRSDNSWKLNAMVTDDNRIREMTASRIWEQIDLADEEVSEPGPRMEYVELILDNDYKGLYCLVEPVDEKKLQLDSNDVLYKVLDHWPFDDEEVQVSINNRWKIVSPVRIRYPEVITDYEMAWYPMRDYTNKVYHSQAGFEKIEEMVCPENIYDMLIFLMVVSGSDNDYKNMYFAAEVAPDGSYVMKQIPWDLDYTFGNVYDYTGRNFTRFDSDVTHEYKEASSGLLAQFMERSNENILQSRWKDYRQSFLCTEAIHQLMLDNRDYLINSGVIARENARWPEYPMSTDIDYLLEFQGSRMAWLDEYFGG